MSTIHSTRRRAAPRGFGHSPAGRHSSGRARRSPRALRARRRRRAVPCRRWRAGDARSDPRSEPRHGQRQRARARASRCRPIATIPPIVRHLRRSSADLVFAETPGDDRSAAAARSSRRSGWRGAGLKNIMVTGDYKDTALAIARDIGLLTPGGLVLTGAEIELLSDAGAGGQRRPARQVCRRVSPQHRDAHRGSARSRAATSLR